MSNTYTLHDTSIHTYATTQCPNFNVRHHMLLRGTPIEGLIDNAVVAEVLLEHRACGVLQLQNETQHGDTFGTYNMEHGLYPNEHS